MPNDEDMENPMVATIGVMAINRLMEEGKWDEAQLLIDKILTMDSGIVSLHRNLLVCDQMYLEIMGQRRSDRLIQMYTKEQTKFMTVMADFPSVIRTEYASALLMQKDMAKASAIKRKFEKIAKLYPYKADIVTERSWMALAEQKAAEHTANGAPQGTLMTEK